MSELKKFLNKAPVDVKSIIESWGIELEETNSMPEKTLGKIAKQQDGSFKISIKKNDYPNRKRFTMAHEFAHFYLHNDKIGRDGIDDFVDENSKTVMYRSNNQSIVIEDETEANKFAASLLMPEHLVIDYCKNKSVFDIRSGEINELKVKEIAKEFEVSSQAMLIRIKGLRNKI